MAASKDKAGTLRELKVGIIGTGGIAGVHITGYQKTEGVELYAACDVIKERAQAVAERHGFKKVFTSFEEMVKDPELDVVSVCTPPFAHRDAAIAALEAGKHVLCEKPMALNGEQAQEMVDAYKRVRRKHRNLFTVGFNARWGQNAQTLKRIIDGGELGEVYYGRAVSHRRRGVPGWGVFTNKALNGGGPMIDIGVHALDMALWLLGHPQPVSVYGVTFQKFGKKKNVYNPWGSWDPKKFDVEDAAFAMIRFKNGAALQLECSWALNIEKSYSQQIICGTEAGAQMHPFMLFGEKHGTLVDTVAPERVTEGQGRAGESTHTLEVQGFIRAIREGAEPLVKPEEAAMVSRIVDAVYKSDETGEAVKL